MELSVVIVNYNHPELLEKCIAALHQSIFPESFEIIVVDNASDYDVSKQIKKFCETYPDLIIKLKQNDKNVGFGRANNQAVELSGGKFILFLNTDCFVERNTIALLHSELISDSTKHIVGPKLMDTNGRPQTSCGPMLTMPIVFAALYLKGDFNGLTRWSPDTTKKVDWVSGACFMISQDNFQKLGGFDEKMFMYMEEIELMYRAKLLKMNTYFISAAKAIHIGAATSKNRTNPVVNIYSGLLYVYRKHFPDKLLYLRILLKTKAIILMFLGILFRNTYLRSTYEKAYKLV